MKFNLHLLTIGTAILTLNSVSTIGQVFSGNDVSNNRAIAASPRAREEFPWLTRDQPRVEKAKGALVMRGKFLAAPRVLEEFPELARSSEPTKGSYSNASTLLKNRALAASPRAQEEFPWLARDNFRDPSFQVAPLK